MDIVREINRRFIEKELAGARTILKKLHGNFGDGQIKMAYLSVVGSKSVNGVAALHTKLQEGT